MPIQQIAISQNAANDGFFTIPNPRKPFSIDIDNGSITGSPTWKLMVSNKNGVESTFKEYNSETTGLGKSDAAQSLVPINFEFLAVKYTANGATGSYSIVMSIPL